jgi:hypothetical protein
MRRIHRGGEFGGVAVATAALQNVMKRSRATYSGGFVPCQQRARWIVNHVSQTRDHKTHVLPRRYVSGECHFYLVVCQNSADEFRS